MATKQRNGKSFAPFEDTVQVPLSPDMRDAIHTFKISPDKMLTALEQLAKEGYAFSLKPNERGGFTTSIQVLDPALPNKGLMVFSNAPSPREALIVMMVKLDFLETIEDWRTLGSLSSANSYS